MLQRYLQLQAQKRYFVVVCYIHLSSMFRSVWTTTELCSSQGHRPSLSGESGRRSYWEERSLTDICRSTLNILPDVTGDPVETLPMTMDGV